MRKTITFNEENFDFLEAMKLLTMSKTWDEFIAKLTPVIKLYAMDRMFKLNYKFDKSIK